MYAFRSCVSQHCQLVATMTNKSPSARRIAVLVPYASALSAPIPMASRMFAGALVELLRWSLDRDETHSPAWVDARYQEVVWLGLGGTKA